MEKKLNNRAVQNLYATYQNKAEVDRALKLLKTVSLHESTYKFLSFFSFRGTKGVTQAKIETICELVGIAKSTYKYSVKPDLESFPEPLIVLIPSQKIGKRPIRKGTRKSTTPVKVRGSSFKVMQPLSKIEQWIPQRQAEIIQNHKDLIKEILGKVEN